MAGLSDGTEPVCPLLRGVSDRQAGRDVFVFREDGVTDGEVIPAKHPRFQTMRGLASPISGAGDYVRIQNDNHRRCARTSRMASSTAASSRNAGGIKILPSSASVA